MYCTVQMLRQSCKQAGSMDPNLAGPSINRVVNGPKPAGPSINRVVNGSKPAGPHSKSDLKAICNVYFNNAYSKNTKQVRISRPIFRQFYAQTRPDLQPVPSLRGGRAPLTTACTPPFWFTQITVFETSRNCKTTTMMVKGVISSLKFKHNFSLKFS